VPQLVQSFAETVERSLDVVVIAMTLLLGFFPAARDTVKGTP